MPRLSVWIARSALLYLCLGFTLGGLMLFNKGIPLHPLIWSLMPLHIESLLFGWTILFVFGVAFWILPRFSSKPQRGNVALVWAAFGLINIGVWLVGLSPFFPAINGLSLLGRLSETLAVLVFAIHAWPRIKPLGA